MSFGRVGLYLQSVAWLLNGVSLAEPRGELEVYSFLRVHEAEFPSNRFSTHPIVGRLSCPAMIQMDLLKKRQVSPFFKKITTKKEQPSGQLWSFQLRDNVRWWSGDMVTIEELRNLWPLYISAAVDKRKLMALPSYKISISEKTLFVHWQKPPRFGPYILSGIPLWKKSEKKSWPGFICAGHFRLKKKNDSYFIQSLKRKKLSVKYTVDSFVESKDANGRWFQLSQQNANGVKCKRYIDHAAFTQIIWNSQLPVTKDIETRKWLDKSLSREHFIQVLLQGNGRQATVPILRGHPGYNRNVKAEKYDLKGAKSFFEKKFKAKRDLNICTSLPADHYVFSFIKESLAGAGWNVFHRKLRVSKTCHGVLQVYASSWPDHFDLAAFAVHPYLGEIKEKLGSAIDRYMNGVSNNIMKFNDLREFHSLLYNDKSVSVLAQHRACIAAGKGFKRQIPPLIVRNLSWFEDLIETGI